MAKKDEEVKEVAKAEINPRIAEIEKAIEGIKMKRIFWATYANNKDVISKDLKRTIDDVHEKTERELSMLQLELRNLKGVK